MRRRIRSDLPRGRFDWLKHGGAAACVAVFLGEGAGSSAPTGQLHNTYLYLQPVQHLYLYAFHLCAAPYLLTCGCVSHLCGRICLLCIFYFSHIHFPPFTLCKKAPGELMMDASDKEKERTDSDGEFSKDFRLLCFFLRRLEKEEGSFQQEVLSRSMQR